MIKPFLRAVKFKYLYGKALRAAANASATVDFPVAFLVGCGRSGTTLAGQCLAMCPTVKYHNEPYHLWAAILPETDVTNLHRIGEASYFLDAQDLVEDKSHIFNSLFQPQDMRNLVLEKTPHNVCRIGFLKKLAPHAKILHIVRNGMMVCSSIKVASESNPYRIFGKPEYNTWWGHEGVKWNSLVRDSVNAGYVAQKEIEVLTSNEQKAAVEWIVSNHEFQNWNKRIPDACHEFLYHSLVEDVRGCLISICEFLSIETNESWLDQFQGAMRPERKTVDIEIRLPPQLCSKFNAIQDRYDFVGRAKLI